MSQSARRSSAHFQKKCPVPSVELETPLPPKTPNLESAVSPGLPKIKLKLTLPPPTDSISEDITQTQTPQLMPKKRGRALSIPDEMAPQDVVTETPLAKKAKGSRTKKKDMVNRDQEVSKPEEMLIDIAPPPQEMIKPKLTKASAPPCSPIPPCDEVQEAAEAKAKIDAEIAELLKEWVHLAVCIEAADIDAEDAEETSAVAMIVERESDDGIAPEPEKKKQAKKRTMKLAKGETRTAIDVAMGEIAEVKKVAKTAETKKATGKKLLVLNKLASGLTPNWRNKTARDDGSSNLSNGMALGGLTDDDLNQEKPVLSKGPKMVKTTCENDFIYIGCTDSEGEVDTLTPSSKQQSRAKATTTVTLSHSIKPTPHKATKKAPIVAPPHVKGKPLNSIPPQTSVASDLKLLPSFA
ncbi:hypothetical protein JAAARDRAFT_200503 [Jaapia argillacea MUCL 33604]|uniref:Uncharacterized protein n=1 Tax=Jaapia argillacea MUCL 33604 TaxID=933084 RepID=A0A067PFS0_9AGAM|nr:hypothetical protein JAAARDRAFT_200503 [Jaapia argillacea MUCL 33604]